MLKTTNNTSTSKERQTKQKILVFIKFCIIGVSSAIVNYVANVLTLLALSTFELKYDYIIANIIGFIISVYWSFHQNSKYTFDYEPNDKHAKFKALMRAYATYAFTGLIINNILSYVWINKLSIPKDIAPLINSIVSLPINYILHRIWVFKAKKGTDYDRFNQLEEHG